MHTLEPYYNWRQYYVSSEDEKSPFYAREYDEFRYSQVIYNYYIHPQWDDFGSGSLYLKILFADYSTGFAAIEFIGEWNDCLHNDIMLLKRKVIDVLLSEGIDKYVLICENVLNFHSSDDCYYEEWFQDCEDGWICMINVRDHLVEEMNSINLRHYVNMGPEFDLINWRSFKPIHLYMLLDKLIKGESLEKADDIYLLE